MEAHLNESMPDKLGDVLHEVLNCNLGFQSQDQVQRTETMAHILEGTIKDS